MKKENAIIAVAAVGVLAFVGGRMTNKPAPEATAPAAAPADVKPEAAPAVKVSLPSYGPEDAKVTIIEISDFQCPFCSRGAATIDQIKKEYAKDVRVVFVNQPLSFHQQAKPAAIAALAAHRQGKFWEMHDKLFGNAKELTEANFKKWAGEIGLDVAKFEKDYADPAIAAQVDRDQKVANALGVRGTPGFFVNGVNISGAQPFENFKKIIDEQIQRANDEIGKGTKPAELNAKLTKANNAALGANIIGLVFEGGNPPADAAGAGADPAKRQKPPEDTTTVWKAALHGAEPTKGNPDALITIVEYTDFQCPFCSKARNSLDEVEKNYGDKVRIVFKNLPLDFHKQAFLAAEAALCGLDQKKFWEMEKKLFENQQGLMPEQLPEHAKAVGMDVGKFEACLKEHKYKAHVEKDMAGAAKIQATGTPAFFINGRKIGGARPFDDFKKIIDEELPKAEAKLKEGVAKKDLYAKLIETGKEFIPPPPLDTKVNDFSYDGSPFLGPRDAKIKIVEYKDFQCPFCARINPALKQVEKNLKGKVALVWKHYPLSSQCNPEMPRDMHPAACMAHYWSMAAEEQGKFWEWEDIIFANFQTMMPADGEMDARLKGQTENMKKYAKEIGMDVAKAEAYVNAKKYEPRLKKDMAEAKTAGVRGTPSLYINGRSYQGPMQAEKMQEIIEQVLAGKL